MVEYIVPFYTYIPRYIPYTPSQIGVYPLFIYLNFLITRNKLFITDENRKNMKNTPSFNVGLGLVCDVI